MVKEDLPGGRHVSIQNFPKIILKSHWKIVIFRARLLMFFWAEDDATCVYKLKIF